MNSNAGLSRKIPKITSWCCVYPVFNVYIYCQKELKEYTKVLAIAYQGNHPFLKVSCYNLWLNSVLMLRYISPVICLHLRKGVLR